MKTKVSLGLSCESQFDCRWKPRSLVVVGFWKRTHQQILTGLSNTHLTPLQRFAATEHSLRRISLGGLTSWPVFRSRAEVFPCMRTVRVKESRLKCLLALDSVRFKRPGVFFCWWDDKKPGDCERADWGKNGFLHDCIHTDSYSPEVNGWRHIQNRQ